VTDPRGAVRLALADFPSDPETEGRRLRGLAESGWEAFAPEAEAVIESGEDTPVIRYLLALFASKGCLAAYLGRLIQSRREIGRRTARLAIRIDPDLDKTLALAILNSHKNDASAPTQSALLEVLAETDRAENLLDSEDPKVRSKTAILVGRAARAQSWARTLREDPDPRVRADAVESLWDQGGAFAAVCYDIGLQDSHHRVLANSLVGLYLVGDCRSIALLAQTATHPDRSFRAAAVWAMGETRDARFVPFLWKLRRDPDNSLARLASTACERILSTQAAADRTPVVIHSLGAHLAPGLAVEARCVVLDENRVPVDLRETDWRPKSGNQPIWRYSVRQLYGLPRLAIICLLPRSSAPQDSRPPLFAAALREGFRSKRHLDTLAVAHYAESSLASCKGSQETHAPDPNHSLSLSPDLRLAVRDAASPPATTSLEPNPLSVAAAALDILRYSPGARHIIFLADQLHPSHCDRALADSLAQSAASAGVSVHLLGTPNLAPELRSTLLSLAIRTGGFNLTLDSIDSLGFALLLLSSAFTRYYELSLPELTSIDRLDLEIMSQSHSGRAQWTVDRETRLADPAPGIHWDREIPPPSPCASPTPASAL